MRTLTPLLLAALTLALLGCPPAGHDARNAPPAGDVKLQAVNLNDPVRPAVHDQPVVLSAARNESIGFALQVSRLANPDQVWLRFHDVQWQAGNAAIPL